MSNPSKERIEPMAANDNSKERMCLDRPDEWEAYLDAKQEEQDRRRAILDKWISETPEGI